MIHLPPLAGAPGAAGASPQEALHRAGFWAVSEAQALVRAGFHGVILENFGDAPFFKDRAPPETIASMAVIAAAVREAVSVPIGINVLRNAAHEALAIAAVSGAEMIRVNVLSGVAATDQGWIEGPAASLLRERERLGVRTAILADVHVKHAQTFSSTDPLQAAEDLLSRSGADAVIFTGSGTGKEVDLTSLERISRALKPSRAPIYVGSGATPARLVDLMAFADGVIVGSFIRKGGKAGAPLDQKRVREFSRAFHKIAPRGARRNANKK